MVHTAAHIMTTSVFTLSPDSSVADAMKLSREHNIRHIPVTDNEQTLLGVVSQRSLFNKALHMLNLYGTEESVHMEQETNIKEVMETECITVATDTPLSEIIPMFKSNRHGCLPVVNNEQKLLGIVTSNNFVDFCEYLLNE